MLVGNKTDLETVRKISPDRGSAEAATSGIRFAEVSAKTGDNVEKALVSFVEDIVARDTFQHKTASTSTPYTGNTVQLEIPSDPAPRGTTKCTC